MKNTKLFTLLFTLVLTIVNSCQTENVEYIDTDFPGAEPKLFAEDFIKSEYRYVQSIDISKDKSEYFFQLTTPNWDYDKIVSLRLDETEHAVFDTLVDSKQTSLFRYCGEPSVTRDGNTLYFSTLEDIWKLTRENDSWSAPIKLRSPVNTEWSEGHPTVSDDGTLYFHSFESNPADNNAIFFSQPEKGGFGSRIKIEELSRDGDAGDPAIAPDESFIVFASARASEAGRSDLFLSFKNDDSWTEPYNLGPEINTDNWELGPMLSDDGKYLFFYRRDNWQNAEYSEIYWVSMEEIIENISNNVE